LNMSAQLFTYQYLEEEAFERQESDTVRVEG
jgi:hypothetical protein